MAVQEIYIRQPQDPKFNENTLDFSDEIEMLISKILMILNTRKGDVLGDYNFGVSIEDLLFTFELSDSELETKILNQIRKYVFEAQKFNLELSIKRFRGQVRDIVLLDFIIDGRQSFGVLVK